MKRQSISLVDRWKERVDDYDSANARTRDMTKLFYIHHHKVNQLLKDPNQSSNPDRILEVTSEIDKILKGADNLKDPFIRALIRDNNINNFKQSFKDLLGMMKTTTKLNQQKQVVHNLIKRRALSATLLKNDKKQNNVHEQIKSSAKRMNSVKAGQSLRIVINQPYQRRSARRVQILADKEQQFRDKKHELENMMKSFIVRKSVTDFKIIGKEERLVDYFNKRQELTDLYLGSKMLSPIVTPKKQCVLFQEQDSEQPHFMTELGVDVSKIKKPIVKKNVDRVIEIVNQKLIDDRKQRQILKHKKLKQIEFDRMAQIQLQSLNNTKRKWKRKDIKVFQDDIEQQKQTKNLMMSTFRTSTSMGRRIYIENTPQHSNRAAEEKMARKFSTRMF